MTTESDTMTTESGKMANQNDKAGSVSGQVATEAPNYKATLSITQTAFPQKAALAASEPLRLEKWREMGLEALLAEKSEGRPKYVLHDGPPYANGDIHLGHALNKTLKDIVVRYRTMRGFAARYVPGFDCHGLPIEQKVLEKLGRKEGEHSQLEIRKLCHEYATRYIDLQTEQFQRLGIGGDWKHPYLTLDPKFEVGILTALRAMVARGSVYKGFKPVWWDPRFRTALAEAELEYERHKSPSIYVRFPVRNLAKVAAFAPFADAPANVVIWTTTPWTLPGDQAVSVNPTYEYVLFETAGERMIAAQDLLGAFAKEAGLAEPKILAKARGAELEGLQLGHPLLSKDVPVILGEHVTLEQGTGCVHTAPGHGPDDFEVCQRYGIEAIVPVDEGGCYNDEYPEMKGTFVFAANPKVIAKLQEKGILVWQGTIEHDYPYSWRSHEPVIVRATHQWFMRLEHDDVREKCLKAIDEEVRWVPAWGHDRIRNMMSGRPDWCLSRQRSWGVPIPVLFSVEANKSILCVEVIDRFQELVAQHGTDCWFSMPVEAFIPEGFKCPISGGTKFEKEFDILDVWFDSGSSHIAVLESDAGLQSPADLYLEGSDQHRGWFMSSLLTSMAARDRAPYKTVLTHGFVLDGKGMAMSKSKGNVISPLDVIKQMGADVLRLWVISEDYRSDIRVSDAILKQMMETYRRIRNTWRFLLGNLADFDPAKDTVAPRERSEIDRWALASLAGLIDGVTQAYEDFEFYKIYHLVNQFCVVTLSALYLDILKDRLYCSAPTDHVRRSAQSTVWDIFSALTRMLAPILPFTSDEAHEYGHPAQPSVHLEDFPVAPEEWRDRDLLRRWERLLAVRDFVNVPLEQARRTGEIGKSLDAAVVLRPRTREMAQFVEANLDALREVCIVSQCRVDRAGVGEATAEKIEEALEVSVGKASGGKCARCWCYDEAIGRDEELPPLCPRCSDVVRRLANP